VSEKNNYINYNRSIAPLLIHLLLLVGTKRRTMARVIHFEIEAEDPELSVAFYKSVFGWQIQNWGGPIDYWLISTGPEEKPGINGAIKSRVPQGQPTTVTIDVPSVDEAIRKITDAGVTILMPRTPIPGVGFHAYARDPGGVIFGVMEADESAE
jgi:uncharacterized protein